MKIVLKQKAPAFKEKTARVESDVREGEGLHVRDGKSVLTVPSKSFAKMNEREFRSFIRSVVQSAKKHKLAQVVMPIVFAQFPKLSHFGEAWFYSTLAENILIGEYEFTKYKSKQESNALKEVVIECEETPLAKSGIARGMIVGESVNVTRSLANTPGNDLTPGSFAKAVKDIFSKTPVTVSVLEKQAIQKLKMGGLLGVGKGAQEAPCFVVLEYWGAGKTTISSSKKSKVQKTTTENPPVVLVGKGITFDSGGLQVKPGMAMYEMHMDMSGGASVVGALRAIALLKIKKNVIGLIPVAENAIGEKAMRPGDVLTMMSGATVDVIHTDAEGRLILADALWYARRYEPKLLVDVATLTGASLVAVGQHASVIMTKDRNLEDRVRELGEKTGDLVFPLPLWSEYKQYTKGVLGDIANIPAGDARFGGTINGATFLSYFTKGMKWLHIDMAPRMTSVASDKLAKGATGEPVRLLVALAEDE